MAQKWSLCLTLTSPLPLFPLYIPCAVLIHPIPPGSEWVLVNPGEYLISGDLSLASGPRDTSLTQVGGASEAGIRSWVGRMSLAPFCWDSHKWFYSFWSHSGSLDVEESEGWREIPWSAEVKAPGFCWRRAVWAGQEKSGQWEPRPESHHQLLSQPSCSLPVHLLPTSRVLGGDQQEMLKVGTILY